VQHPLRVRRPIDRHGAAHLRQQAEVVGMGMTDDDAHELVAVRPQSRDRRERRGFVLLHVEREPQVKEKPPALVLQLNAASSDGARATVNARPHCPGDWAPRLPLARRLAPLAAATASAPVPAPASAPNVGPRDTAALRDIERRCVGGDKFGLGSWRLRLRLGSARLVAVGLAHRSRLSDGLLSRSMGAPLGTTKGLLAGSTEGVG
jgi:hypothetical protein